MLSMTDGVSSLTVALDRPSYRVRVLVAGAEVDASDADPGGADHWQCCSRGLRVRRPARHRPAYCSRVHLTGGRHGLHCCCHAGAPQIRPILI